MDEELTKVLPPVTAWACMQTWSGSRVIQSGPVLDTPDKHLRSCIPASCAWQAQETSHHRTTDLVLRGSSCMQACLVPSRF